MATSRYKSKTDRKANPSTDLLVNQSQVKMPTAFVRQWMKDCRIQFAKKKLKSTLFKKTVTIVFLDSPEAKKINLQFRGRNYATDVLSFQSADPQSLGELVICPQVVQKQAKEHGLSFKEELAYMILHGFLHLLGFDHEVSQAKAKKMFQLQDDIFESLID